jgi:hypothetical protein
MKTVKYLTVSLQKNLRNINLTLITERVRKKTIKFMNLNLLMELYLTKIVKRKKGLRNNIV